MSWIGRTSMPGVSMGTTISLMPGVRWPVGRGPADEVAVVGDLAEAGPDLLAVDDEVVAVADRPGLERGQVRAGLGLAHPDAPRGLTGQDAGEELARPGQGCRRSSAWDPSGGRRTRRRRSGAPAEIISSATISRSMGGRPPPPCSTGHVMPIQPCAGQLAGELAGEAVDPGVVVATVAGHRLLGHLAGLGPAAPPAPSSTRSPRADGRVALPLGRDELSRPTCPLGSMEPRARFPRRPTTSPSPSAAHRPRRRQPHRRARPPLRAHRAQRRRQVHAAPGAGRLLRPDRGTVRRQPAAATVGLLDQEPERRAGETVGAFLARRTGVAAATTELETATLALAAAADVEGERARRRSLRRRSARLAGAGRRRPRDPGGRMSLASLGLARIHPRPADDHAVRRRGGQGLAGLAARGGTRRRPARRAHQRSRPRRARPAGVVGARPAAGDGRRQPRPRLPGAHGHRRDRARRAHPPGAARSAAAGSPTRRSRPPPAATRRRPTPTYTAQRRTL